MQQSPLISPNSSAPSPSSSHSVDVDQHNFMADVVEASQKQPVLVDFWAPWCNPCKQLTPILEKVVHAAEGRVKLAKIDVEANQALASQLSQLGLPLQSIPLIVAFWQGQVHDLLQGMQPESELRRFVDAIIKKSGQSLPTATLLEGANSALKENNLPEATSLYAQALENDGENPIAWAGLIRCMIAMDDPEGADEAARQVPESIAQHAEITSARAALALYQDGKRAAEQLESLQATLEAHPDDLPRHIELATALNGAGRYEEAAATLLNVIRQDRNGHHGQAAKAELLRFFDAWGMTDPHTVKARRQLSSLLFV